MVSSSSTSEESSATASTAFVLPPPLLERRVVFFADSFVYNSLKSTNSIKHISALSPSLYPVRIIRVYPPCLSIIFGATSLNSSLTTSLFCRYLNTDLLECVESVFAFVRIGSTNPRRAFALATVVLILLCSINEQAILESIAFLCAVFLPK